MYAPDINTLFVEVPRTGMRSLESALKGKLQTTNVGHYTVSRFLKETSHKPTQVVAVIRDPFDRLLSAVNFSCGDREALNKSFEKLVSDGWDTSIVAPTSQEELGYVFCPQTAYLDVDLDYTLFSFGRMQSLYDKFFGGLAPPHTNKSRKSFTKDDLKEHPLFEDVMQVYEKDVDLYNKLNP